MTLRSWVEKHTEIGCDIPECTATFEVTTGSRRAYREAQRQGWGATVGKNTREQVHVCPEHKDLRTWLRWHHGEDLPPPRVVNIFSSKLP